MNQHEIDELIEAQADLQTALGFFRLRENFRIQGGDVGESTWIEERMDKALDRLHDLLAENGKLMGKHMQRELLNRGVSPKSLGLSAEEAEGLRASSPCAQDIEITGEPFTIGGMDGLIYPAIQPDPQLRPGHSRVRINGSIYLVRGVECYKSIDGDKPGKPIGVWVGSSLEA